MDLLDVLSDKPVQTNKEPVIVEPDNVPRETSGEETLPPVQKIESTRQAHAKKELIAQGRDPETGKFVPVKEEPKVEAKPEVKPEVKPEPKPVEELTAKEKAAFAKAADETRKRQALEHRLRELEAQIQARPASTEPPKTFWDDPEAALNLQKQEIQAHILQARFQTSESIARTRLTDYDEKAEIFKQMASSAPWLVNQMVQSPDPADFVYKTAKSHKELQEAGGIDALREKIRAETEVEVRGKLEKELQAKQEALEKERAALPGSLSNVQSKGVNRPVWGGPTALDSILKGK